MRVEIAIAAAHTVGILPLLWLGALRITGRPLPAAWWWMALAFGVSFLADSVAHAMGPTVVSQVYPVTQAALFALVLLPRADALTVVGVLLAAASSSIVVRSGEGLDVLLRVIAWGTVAGMGLWLRGPLRVVMTGGFAMMTLGWLWYVTDPAWASWGGYQSARLVTAIGWGWVAWTHGGRDG